MSDIKEVRDFVNAYNKGHHTHYEVLSGKDAENSIVITIEKEGSFVCCGQDKSSLYKSAENNKNDGSGNPIPNADFVKSMKESFGL